MSKQFTSSYQKVFVKKPLVEAAPPSEAVETSERVAARLHAGKWRWALAGGGAFADAVCEPALAHDGDGGAFRVSREHSLKELCDTVARLGELGAPGVVGVDFVCIVCIDSSAVA